MRTGFRLPAFRLRRAKPVFAIATDMETLEGFPCLPAFRLRRAKPVFAIAIWLATHAAATAAPSHDGAASPKGASLPSTVAQKSATPSKTLAAFHQALEKTRVRASKTHVLFFGDSHTAADCMTGRLRERLQADYGDGGPGFLMLGKPWPFFYHGREQVLESRGLKASYVRKRPDVDRLPLGLSGVALNGSDVEPISSRVRVVAAPLPTGRPLHGEMHFLKQPDGAMVDVLLDGKPLASFPTAGLPGLGYFAFDTDDGRHELELHAPAQAPLTLFGMVAELEGAGVVVDTLGVPGARARAQLYWNPDIFGELLRRRNPDLWVLAYGTNESTDAKQPIDEYASTLGQVIANLQAAAPAASCLLVGPPDFPERVKKDVYRERERTTQINQLQRSIAERFGCWFFDTIAFMGGPLSMVEWAKRKPALGAKDLVHLTKTGYEMVGDAIADAILPPPPPRRHSESR